MINSWVSNENLQRNEAADRSALITTHSYDVSLDVRKRADPDAAGYTSRSIITFSARRAREPRPSWISSPARSTA